MKKKLERLKNFYYNLRLQTKFTITHLVIAAIPMLVLGIFFYVKLYDMIVADTIRTEQASSAQTAPLIEEAVQKVLDTSNKFSNLNFYREIFQRNRTGTLDDMADSKDTQEFRRQTEELIDGELVTDIRIYMDIPGTQKLFSSPETSNIILPISEAKGTYWYGIFKGNNVSSYLYCPSFYLSPYEIEHYGDLALITKESVFYEGEVHTCYTAIYYSMEILDSLLKDNLTSSTSVAYIVNERDSIIATSDDALAGTYHFSYDTVQDAFMSSNNFILKHVLNEDVYAGFYSIDKAGWYMVVAMPSKPMIIKSIYIMAGFLLVFLACILFAVLIALNLSKSITNRISAVIHQMTLVRTGPPVPLPAPDRGDEIGDLIDSYNYMTTLMNQLMEDQAKAAEDLRISEFNSLQAQMNPHFLYNTMDMINWLAQKGRPQEVSAAIQDLSRFYKLTLSRKKSVSTIADEIEHVSIYVRLQNMRFHNGIDFVVDIPDALMEYPIPRLTFQPVIENAILHGILEKDQKEGTIVLTGWLQENTIVILISDDGVGIPADKLPTILSGNGDGSKGTNIAVYNTHRRLQLLYGTDYGLFYSSTDGKGTDVEIRIPIQTEEKTIYAKPAGMLAAKTYLPLVMVSPAQDHAISDEAVSPLTLLRYNKKLTNDTYTIHNLHQISDKLPKGENIYILSHKVTEDFPAHTHGYYEINYICQGAVINIVDSQELYMSAGDMMILNPEAVQSLKYTQPDTLLLNICLHRPLFEYSLRSFYKEKNPLSDFFQKNSLQSANYMFYSLGHSLKAQTIISSIIQEYAKAGFHQTPSLEGLFLLFFDHLAHSEEYSHYGVDNKTLQTLTYIRSNCLHKTISEMADALDCPELQLKESIKKHLGRDLSEIIREVKVNHALQLLSRQDLNIYSIAEACGYEHAQQFFIEFKEQFGISPEEYRKQFM